MFLFNSLHKGSNASKSPASRSPVFAFAVMFCLFTALLFIGCTVDAPEVIVQPADVIVEKDECLHQDIIGTWLSTTAWGTDGYSITAARLVQIRSAAPGSAITSGIAGTIEDVAWISANSGAIIVLANVAVPQKDADGNDVYVDAYIVTYFKDLVPGVYMKMGDAWETHGSWGDPDYASWRAQQPTLDEAKAAFGTKEAMDKYLTYPGNYYELTYKETFNPFN
jgi:hypothetical protein